MRTQVPKTRGAAVAVAGAAVAVAGAALGALRSPELPWAPASRDVAARREECRAAGDQAAAEDLAARQRSPDQRLAVVGLENERRPALSPPMKPGDQDRPITNAHLATRTRDNSATSTCHFDRPAATDLCDSRNSRILLVSGLSSRAWRPPGVAPFAAMLTASPRREHLRCAKWRPIRSRLAVRRTADAVAPRPPCAAHAIAQTWTSVSSIASGCVGAADDDTEFGGTAWMNATQTVPRGRPRGSSVGRSSRSRGRRADLAAHSPARGAGWPPGRVPRSRDSRARTRATPPRPRQSGGRTLVDLDKLAAGGGKRRISALSASPNAIARPSRRGPAAGSARAARLYGPMQCLLHDQVHLRLGELPSRGP